MEKNQKMTRGIYIMANDAAINAIALLTASTIDKNHLFDSYLLT
jgi:hypothetical protein